MDFDDVSLLYSTDFDDVLLLYSAENKWWQNLHLLHGKNVAAMEWQREQPWNGNVTSSAETLDLAFQSE